MSFLTLSTDCCWATFFIPAFSAKGEYFAITAIISTYGVPACGRVSRISFSPSPMSVFGVDYYAVYRAKLSFSCCIVILGIRRLPAGWWWVGNDDSACSLSLQFEYFSWY